MPEFDALYQQVYGDAGGGRGGSPTVETWRQQLGLDALERQHNLPQGLMTSVLRQESGGDPRVRSSAGAQGLFQFMPATAAQYRIDPLDPQQAAPAAARELSSLYRKYGGDVDRTLAAWNWGQGHVDRQGLARMPAETRGFVANVKRWLSPGVAEAAERPLAPGAAVAAGDDLYQQVYGSAPRPPAAQPAPGTTPPSAPVSQTPPPAPTPAAARQGPPQPTLLERFDALPAVQSWSPEDRAARRQEFAALRPEYQEEFLRGEERPAPGAATSQAPGTVQVTLQPAAAPSLPRTPEERAQRAVQERDAWEREHGRPWSPTSTGVLQSLGNVLAGRGWSEGDPLMPSQRPGLRPSDVEPPVEESLTAPSTLLPLLMGGAGLKAVQGTLAEAAPWVGRFVRPLAEGLSQTLGFGTGRTIETGQVPSAGELGTEAVLNVGTGAVFEGVHAGVQAILRRSQAGRVIAAADDATRAAQQEWQTAAAEARAAQQAGRTEAYQAAERKARDAQARYQQRVQTREATIQANQQTYQDAVQQYEQEVTTARTQGYLQTEQDLAQQQRTYQGQVAGQAADVAAQQQALQTARAVPGRYAPETPSWVLYEKFGDAAQDAVVDLAPAKAGLAEVRASRGVLPDGTARPFPSQVEQIASTLERAEGSASVQTIRDELRRLGPLTRSPNGDIRGPAKQLYGLYADALEASPVANELLRSANATFRKEMALQDVSEWLRPGHGVVRIDQQGRQTINVGAMLTKLEKAIGDDTQFARSFAPDELQALRTDLGRLAGTPRMPTRTLQAPQPALLPGSAPDVPARLQTPPTPPGIPAEVPRPRPELLPGGAGLGRRGPAVPPEPAPVTPQQALGDRPKLLGPRAGEWGAILATLQAIGVPTAPLAVLAGLRVTQKQASWLLANALLSPRGRAVIEAARDGQMRLNPRVYGALVATLSPEEKQAYERETRARR